MPKLTITYKIPNPLPDWANWVAQDADGVIFVYKSKPKYDKKYQMWVCSDTVGIHNGVVTKPHKSVTRIKRKTKDAPNPSGVRDNDVHDLPSTNGDSSEDSRLDDAVNTIEDLKDMQDHLILENGKKTEALQQALADLAEAKATIAFLSYLLAKKTGQ